MGESLFYVKLFFGLSLTVLLALSQQIQAKVAPSSNEISNFIEEIVPELRNECSQHPWRQASKPMQDDRMTKAKQAYGLFFGSNEQTYRVSKSSHCEQYIKKSLKSKFKDETGRLWKHALKHLEKKKILKSSRKTHVGAGDDFTAAADPQACPYPQNLVCPRGSKYRTYDGSCNNKKLPLMGAAMTPYRRLSYIDYADGISQPRLAKSGSDLPSARQIVLEYMNDDHKLSPDFSLYFPMFGQFISHDLAKTAVDLVPANDVGDIASSTGSASGGSVQEADCGEDGCETEGVGREMCYPIPILPSDPDFSGQRCLRNVRSTQVPALNCSSGPSHQMPVVSHWLDGSHIYGSSLATNQKLRNLTDPNRGRLLLVKSTDGNSGKDMLPLLKDHIHENLNGAEENCVLAGDSRASVNGILSVMHTLFAREHNYLESVLHNLNPDWDGEKLFQETRRIIGAFLQHITYTEYLPFLVGPKIIREYELNLLKEGHFTGYREDVDARVCSEFVTASHRYGHSMMPDKLHRLDSNGQDSDLYLSQTMFDARWLYDHTGGGLDGLAEGAAQQNPMGVGCAFSKQITRSLFTSSPPNGIGLDLASADIQRGRDNGIPAYNELRPFFELKKAKDFEDLITEIPTEKIKGLKKLYGDVDDIDFFVGGLSEIPVEGGLVGPSFAKNIADNFQHLRKGDRFWYESESGGFSEEQLRVIRGITLTEIICRNSDTIQSLQRYSMMSADDKKNPKVDCKEFEELDLSAWIEHS